MSPNEALDLSTWRRQAAEASGGISSDEIYTMIEETLTDLQLGGRILDYGAGLGNLSKRLLSMRRFESLCAADIMDKPDGLAGVVWLREDLNNPIQGYASYFEVVVAAEVIKHLENPRSMVRDLFRLCRPGGYIVLTTPNNESLRALISLVVRGHYVAFNDSGYPAHITALLRKDLSRILQEAGFEPPRFRFTQKGAVPGLTRFTWQGASGGLLRGIHFSDGVLAVAQKPP
jgi:2-polyprenyl-3-methyl-5-hydroxy-6-metoxy-1,4-benzoquinol methylase